MYEQTEFDKKIYNMNISKKQIMLLFRCKYTNVLQIIVLWFDI